METNPRGPEDPQREQKFTPAVREEIQRMAGIGMSLEEIAFVIESTPQEVDACCRLALRKGRAMGVAKVAGQLMKAALKCDEDPRFLPAAMFYLRAVGGWREKSEVEIKTGPSVRTVTVQVPTSTSARKLKEADA